MPPKRKPATSLTSTAAKQRATGKPKPPVLKLSPSPPRDPKKTAVPRHTAPTKSKPPLASENSNYIYHAIAAITTWDEDDCSNEGQFSRDVLGTFNTAQEANLSAREYARDNSDEYGYESDDESDDDNGRDRRGDDGLFFFEFEDVGNIRGGDQRGIIEATLEEVTNSSPEGTAVSRIWAVVAEGKNTGVYASKLGAVKAVERCMAGLKEKGDGNAEYGIEENGLLGVRVVGAVREAVVRVEKWKVCI